MERKSFPAILALATIAKLILALSTSGTNDVRFYEKYAERAAQPNAVALYQEPVTFTRADGRLHREPFWHPPFLLNVLPVVLAASQTTGIPFPFLFRLLSILADIGSSLLLWRVYREGGLPGPWWTPHLFAGSPVLLLLSGFHGNTDPLMLFFLLLAVWLLDSRRPAWLAGLAFGMSISIKVWPFLLFPLLVLSVKTIRDRGLFALTAAAVFLITGLPFLAQDPVMVLRHVLSYRSLSGQWGLSQILVSLPAPELSGAFEAYGAFAVLAICMAATFWMHMRSAAGLLASTGFITALFLALTPGFGIQYLAWLLPWLAALGGEHLLLYSLSAGVFQFLVYNFWARGLPWNFADSTMVGPWRDSLILFEIVCWLVVLYLAGQFAFVNGLIRSAAPCEPSPAIAAATKRSGRRR